MTTIDENIPEGFERQSRRQSAHRALGTDLFKRQPPDAIILGLRLATPHTNARGFAHGGLIAALTDKAMGHSCGHRMRGAAQSLVTVEHGDRFHRQRPDRAMARGRDRGDQTGSTRVSPKVSSRPMRGDRPRQRQRFAWCRSRKRSRHSGATRSVELWCAIAHLSISRFRVWSFATHPGMTIDPPKCQSLASITRSTKTAHLGRQQPRGRIDDVDRQRRLLEFRQHDFQPAGLDRGGGLVGHHPGQAAALLGILDRGVGTVGGKARRAGDADIAALVDEAPVRRRAQGAELDGVVRRWPRACRARRAPQDRLRTRPRSAASRRHGARPGWNPADGRSGSQGRRRLRPD